MPVEIFMPSLSPAMSSAKLVRWLVEKGDDVFPGLSIAEVETDKATMEVAATQEGRIAAFSVEAGARDIAVGDVIGWMLTEREALNAAPVASASEDPASSENPAPDTDPAPTFDLLLPSLSPSMESATLARWLVRKGDKVSSGDVVAEVETDKATLEVEVVEAGVIGEILVADGTADVPVGAVIATIVRDADRATTTAKATLPHSDGRAAPVRSAGNGTAHPQTKSEPDAPPVDGNTLHAAQPKASADEEALRLFDKAGYETVPHDTMRRTIARRLTEAKSTVPHFYLTVDVELDALLALRERINADAATDGNGNPSYRISVNDLVIKAYALGLRSVPDANVSWTEAAMIRHRVVDVGVAVAMPDGLITPIIRDAAGKPLSILSNEMKDLALRAKARELRPDEYQGGTGSVSNLGMLGVKSFSAIVNPPHATILAVGAADRRVVARGDEIKIASVLSLTLSTDHRAVDGALGARLMQAIKDMIEHPLRLLI